MPVSSGRSSSTMSFNIPSGLTELLQEFTVAVLRSHPHDLYQFAADYFNERRVGPTKNSVANGLSSMDDQRTVPVITTTLSHRESLDEEPSGKISTECLFCVVEYSFLQRFVTIPVFRLTLPLGSDIIILKLTKRPSLTGTLPV